jgi:MFS family permease
LAILSALKRNYVRGALGSDFAWLWRGSTTSQLGSVSAMAAFPLLALSLDHSPVLAGWVTAATTLPPLLLQLPAGVLIERRSRWRVMIVSQVVRAISAFLLFLALLAFAKPVAALLAAAVVEGICVVFYNTAELTSVPRVVQHELLPIAMAKNEARSQTSLLLGRPVGGLLFAVSRSWPYILDALAGCAAIFSLMKVDKEKLRPLTTAEPGIWRALRKGLKHLLHDRFLRNVLIVCTITNFLFQIVILLFVVLAESQHRSGLFIGIILAASGLGGLIGSFVARWVFKTLGARNIIVSCVAAWTLLTGIIAWWHQPVAMLVAWGGVGFVGAHVNVALAIYQSSSIPRELLARVASASSFVTRFAAALGALCAGYVVSAAGPRVAAYAVFWIMILLAAAVGVHRLFATEEPGITCVIPVERLPDPAPAKELVAS